ncbi:MAG: hypothetical protein KGL39_27050 [Patescibacteria group bacterium]|nr:hypothetical protein [Patescibacteria group bacterium]
MSKDLKVPGVGRVTLVSPIRHESSGFGIGRLDAFGSGVPTGHLTAVIRDKDGKIKEAAKVMTFWSRFWGNIRGNATEINLGSGLVTNVGVLAMANEYNWANPSGAVNTVLALANYHASGTGATAAAATDIKLQTSDGIASVAGTQSLVSAANSQAYKTVATINYTGTEAVTEWGLHTNGTLSATTGTPFTATSATSATVTGTPYTASSSTVAGQQMNIVVAGTTTVWGLILSNTSSVLTIPAWYKTADGTAGSTPGGTEALTLRPVLWDHKVFSALNVINGDSIQYSYTVTINSGG